jgi:hypothetical protein
MSTRQKEVLILAIAFAIIAGGFYAAMKSMMSTGVSKDYADAFECHMLYSYPKVWACGYVTDTGITLDRFYYNKEGEF